MEEKIIQAKRDNDKPLFIQRLASGLVDLCLVFLLYWGMYTISMNTPISRGFDNFNYQVVEIQDAAKLETGYGNKVYITDENKDEYTNYYKHYDEENKEYVVVNVKDVSQTVTQAYVNKLNNDPIYKSAVFNRRFVLYGINVLAGTISTAVFLLGVPLINKRRATLGQLAGEISMFSTRYETHARWYHILIRYLFMFVIEMALPFLFLELYTFIAIPAIYLIVGSATKSGRTLHDLVSGVRPIDKKTYAPMVPEIVEEVVVEEDKKDAE